MRDTRGNLGTGGATSGLDDLFANLFVDCNRGLLGHQFIPVGVSCANNLDLVDIVGVESGSGHANPVHLANEDLVTEEVATPDSAIRVGIVLASLSGHIDELTQNSLSGVVLLLSIVKMLSILLDIVVTNHMLQELEGVVVLVARGRGIVEDTNVGVVHLIVTHHEESGNVDAWVGVGLFCGGFILDGAEALVDELDEKVMIDATSANNDDVLASEVGCAILVEHIGSNVLNAIRFTTNGLSHLMVSEGVVMDCLNGSIELVFAHGFVFLSLLGLGNFEFS